MKEDGEIWSGIQGTTLRVAVTVLCLGFFAEVLAVSWIHVPRLVPALRSMGKRASPDAPAAKPSSPPSPFALATPPVAPVPLAPPAPVQPAPPAPAPGVAKSPSEGGAPGKTAKGAPAAKGPSPGPDAVGGYLAAARASREKGDMPAALEKLREAERLAPKNGEVQAELAVTYERMGLADKAAAQWQTLASLGAGAGEFHRLAIEKIRRGGTAAGTAPPPAVSAPDDVARNKAEGFSRLREQALLVIDGIETKKALRDDGVGQVDLKIPVRRQRKETVDSVAVTIQVDFYDMLDDQHVVLTNADVASEWQTSPANWEGADTEVVSVYYHQTGVEREIDSQAKRRKYLGYVVRVYYRSQLQDMRADPARLLDLFPPTPTLNETDARP